MALVAMTTADTVDFVSDRDPAKIKTQAPVDPHDDSKGTRDVIEIGDDASVFKIRPLDVFLMGHIYDSASVLRGRQGQDEIGIHTRVNQTNIDTVRFGLVSIPSNFRRKDGSPVRMKTEKAIVNGREYDAATVDVLNSLGIQLIGEMAGKIKEISEVTAAEEKNSARGSLPSG